ncbi:unnamed protein product [Caenorhabditis angaria]|uniref:Uncharacterized protein n=1 Tax=Caenorhabditis angaria TaxID=860376 RepID=A0A9P1IIW2_9PELO|nr:unnamed protein product [Caenorhabditis angaria]
MSQNDSKNVDAIDMSKKTYKKEVAKQRQIKRMRKMKLRDRQDDVRISDVSDMSVNLEEVQKEDNQADWLNDLVKTEPKNESSVPPAKSSSQDDIRCTAELPRSKSPVLPKEGGFCAGFSCIWQFIKNNRKTTILSVSAIVLAILWKIRN